MVAILVGAMARILTSSIISPTSLIFFSLVMIFLIAAVLHPREFTCLFPSTLYFIASPSAFILMNIYALMNLNNVSWGTRETKSDGESKKPKTSWFVRFFNRMLRIKSSRKRTYSSSVTKTENYEKLYNSLKTTQKKMELVDDECLEVKALLDDENSKSKSSDETSDENVSVMGWFEHSSLETFRNAVLNSSESIFFEQLIEKYLTPLDPKKEAAKKEVMTEKLKDLRNSSCFGFLLLNSFWILVLFTLQLFKDKLKDRVYIKVSLFNVSEAYEPVSFCYILLFVVMLFLQFFAMLWHRFITLIQIIRKTNLRRTRLNSASLNSKIDKVGHLGKIRNGNENLVYESGEVHTEHSADSLDVV
jgi:chitin synthase